MSSLYTRIAIVRSNMHVAVDVNHVIDVQIPLSIPAYPRSYRYKTPYTVIVEAHSYVTYYKYIRS